MTTLVSASSEVLGGLTHDEGRANHEREDKSIDPPADCNSRGVDRDWARSLRRWQLEYVELRERVGQPGVAELVWRILVLLHLELERHPAGPQCRRRRRRQQRRPQRRGRQHLGGSPRTASNGTRM